MKRETWLKKPYKAIRRRAKEVFHEWIRYRDRMKGCVSCNGSVEHAGHYYAAHLYRSLEFNETNVNGQCLKCNYFMSGNLSVYRERLEQRWGDDAVMDLEIKSSFERRSSYVKLLPEELVDIIMEYTQKLKEIA